MLGTLQAVPLSALTAGRALHEWVEGQGVRGLPSAGAGTGAGDCKSS